MKETVSHSKIGLSKNQELLKVLISESFKLSERQLFEDALRQFNPQWTNFTDQLSNDHKFHLFVLDATNLVQCLDRYEKLKLLNPLAVPIFYKQIWSFQELETILNVNRIFHVLDGQKPDDYNLILVHSVEISKENHRRSGLLKKYLQLNRELESLNLGLEGIVADRTAHIQIAKEQEESNIVRVRQLIRFIKELSGYRSLEELLDLLKRESHRLLQLSEVFLILTNQESSKIYFFQGMSWNSHSINSFIPSEKNEHFNRELQHYLANGLGRPVGKVYGSSLSIENENQGVYLVFELSQNEEQIAQLSDWIADRKDSLSMAIHRAILEKEMIDFSYRWERTFDALKDPIAIIDIDHNVVRSNKKFFEGLLTNKCYQLFADREKPCDGCPLDLAAAKKQNHVSQIKIQTRTYEAYSFPVMFSNQTSATTFVHQYVDRTEERDLFLRLLQNEKMNSIGQLAAHIAHELNNPLTGLRSLAQLLAEEAPIDSVRADFVEIQKAAERSQKIIKNLLEYSRQDLGDVSQVMLKDIVQLTIPLFKTVMRFHRLELDLKQGDEIIFTNLHLTQQVLFNLVTNASQAMVQKGVLKISTELDQGGEFALIKVSDSGPGISPEILDKIFEPFFTTKEIGKGTGLGLYLARDIMKKMNGDLLVKSELGKGSEFTIKIFRQLRGKT